jgi:hypothetical protein
MTKTDGSRGETGGLEPFFEAARQAPPEASEALLARVMADADAVARTREAAALARPAARPGRLRGLLESLGGWPALAGLTAASAAGLALGVAMPDTVTGLFQSGGAVEVFELSDLSPGLGTVLGEEG